MNQKYFILFLFSIVLLLTNCGGMICKGKDENGIEKTVVFDYDPYFKTVDVGGAPTYVQNGNTPWVKKLIVEEEGFLVVTEVKTAGFEQLPCEDNKEKLCDKHIIRTYNNLQTYKKGEAYKYWYKISEKEWTVLSRLEDRPEKQPSFQAEDCRFSLFGSFLEILLAIFRI